LGFDKHEVINAYHAFVKKTKVWRCLSHDKRKAEEKVVYQIEEQAVNKTIQHFIKAINIDSIL